MEDVLLNYLSNQYTGFSFPLANSLWIQLEFKKRFNSKGHALRWNNNLHFDPLASRVHRVLVTCSINEDIECLKIFEESVFNL